MAERKEHFREPPKGYLPYFIVFLVLVGISMINTIIFYLNLGGFGSFLILILASIQVLLLGLFFMYLRYEDKLTIAFALMPLFFIFLLIMGNVLDSHFNKKDLIEYQRNVIHNNK